MGAYARDQQQHMQTNGSGGIESDVDIDQLREILAFTDTDVARMPPSEDKDNIVKVLGFSNV